MTVDEMATKTQDALLEAMITIKVFKEEIFSLNAQIEELKTENLEESKLIDNEDDYLGGK